jgi:hypothetical protein
MKDDLLDLLLFAVAAVALFVIVGLFAAAMDRAYPNRPAHHAVERKGR